jgi:cytochrome P450
VALLLQAITRARVDGQGLLGRLAAARYEDGTGLSDDSLVDNLLTTLVAGHETSVLSLCWAMFWVHHHPGTLARLRAELDGLEPEAEPGDYAALPYLDAVVRETLRLWPAVADINRVLAQPMELGGYTLPPGTVVAGATAILHYDPDLFPDPERFDPERFMNRKFAAWEYTPFGGGERMCPGAQFSAFELKIILATLLRRGDYTLLEDGIPEVKRLGFLMAPKTGVRLRYEGPR